VLIVKTTPYSSFTAPDADPPVPFIVGASRSGTTLLRLMLDTHPEIAIPPETHFIPKLARRCQTAHDQRQCFLEMLESARNWRDFHIDIDVLGKRLQAHPEFDLSTGLQDFYRLYAERFGKRRWGDKTPLHLTHMSLIQELLPSSRFIHLIRDGRDVALSLRDVWFGPASIEEVPGWWISRISAARSQLEDLRFYLEVRYEDLVLQTEVTLRRICEFAELPWHPAILSYHQRAEERLAELEGDVVSPRGDRIVKGAERVGIHTLTTRPPEPTRVYRWRREMDETERRRFESIAGSTLRELGYEAG
jgi:hypothetical protein